LPSVRRAADGTLLLAYLTRPPERTHWEVWVAPIGLDRPDGTPRVLESARRRLGEGAAAIAPAFSPDGRWVFAAMYDEENQTLVRRFAANDGANGSFDADRATKNRWQGRRGHHRR